MMPGCKLLHALQTLGSTARGNLPLGWQR